MIILIVTQKLKFQWSKYIKYFHKIYNLIIVFVFYVPNLKLYINSNIMYLWYTYLIIILNHLYHVTIKNRKKKLIKQNRIKTS